MDDLRAQLNGGDGESSCLAKMAILPRVVFRIVACDIFVSLRVIYLACVVQATAMIIRQETWCMIDFKATDQRALW